MSTNDLAARYVRAVTGSLPKGERDDVARELRSLIDDMLAERAGDADRAGDEATTVAVLRELGQPEAVAERYGRPRPHLVGPAYYPTFKAVTSIVVGVLGALYLVPVVWSLVVARRPPEALLAGLPGSLFELGTMVLANVGLIALIFAAIERATPAAAPEEADWDPRKLPAVGDPDRLERTGQAFELGFDVAALAWFNAIVVGGGSMLFVEPEAARRLSLELTPGFLALAPWINAMLVLGIGLGAVLLWRGRWQPATRVAAIAINVASLYVVARVLALPDIAAAHWLDLLCRMVFGGILVVTAIETVQQVVRLARRPRAAAPADVLAVA